VRKGEARGGRDKGGWKTWGYSKERVTGRMGGRGGERGRERGGKLGERGNMGMNGGRSYLGEFTSISSAEGRS